ncbi:MAG: hypothetical protein WBV93_17980 [Anaerobacillus sp.]
MNKINAVLVILMAILVSAIIVSTKRISGDDSAHAKEDERQKRILKDATISSWQIIMLYAFLRLTNLFPFVNDFVNPSNMQSFAFLSNGGDLLLVAFLGYGIGAVTSYYRYS